MTTARRSLWLLLGSYVAAWLLSSPALFRWNRFATDTLFELRQATGIGQPVHDRRVALLLLTDECRARMGKAYVGRDTHAAVVRALGETGVAVQAHDTIFRARQLEAHDRLLEEAVRDAGAVLFGSVVTDRSPGPEASWPPVQALTVEGDLESLPRAEAAFASYDGLQEASRGHGLLNVEVDGDGVIRRVPLVVRAGDGFFTGLALRAACEVLGVEDEQVVVRPDRVTLVLPGPDVVIPMDRDGQLRVNFLGPWGSLDHYRFSDLWEASGDPAELAVWRHRFRDRVVVVADTSIDTGDLGAVPVDRNYPLAGVHASAVHTILTGDFLRELGTWEMLPVELLLLLALFLLSRLRGSRRYVLGTSLLLVAYLAGSAALFLGGGWILGLVRPVLLCSFGVGTTVVARYLDEERQEAILRSSFEAYFPPAVVRQVLADPQLLQATGQRKELTILFSDLHGFTRMTQSMKPREVHAMLNEYFEAMVEIAFEHGATVDKFIGDGLMIFFGDPEPQEDHALRAVRTALAMQERVAPLNRGRQVEGAEPLSMRIGIHTGPVIVGNMGSRRRLAYTAVGSAVNLAARLEAAAPPGGILISQPTQALLEGKVPVRPVEAVRAKGFDEPVPVFLVESGGSPGNRLIPPPSGDGVPGSSAIL